MKRVLLICGIGGLHLLTVFVLFAFRKALLAAESAQAAESLATSVIAGVLRTLLFPVVEIVIQSRIKLPEGWLSFGVLPFNSLLWGLGLFYLIHWLHRRKTRRVQGTNSGSHGELLPQPLMLPSVIEVKSALWQKLFITPIALLLIGFGVLCFLSPVYPVLSGPPPNIFQVLCMGTVFVASGFGIWWPVIKYSIRANHEGITQHNGFFRQSVRWSEVATYYMEPNRRFHGEQRYHIEPVMFDANGTVVFRGFAHILVSTKKIIEQRRQLWQFVESQLEGKKVDAPSPDRDPEVLARRTLAVNWAKKSLWWKIGRIVAVICYALFWTGLIMLPIYYLTKHNITIPKPWGQVVGSLLGAFMFIGPLLPHIIWIHFKKRQIAKELEKQGILKDSTEHAKGNTS